MFNIKNIWLIILLLFVLNCMYLIYDLKNPSRAEAVCVNFAKSFKVSEQYYIQSTMATNSSKSIDLTTESGMDPDRSICYLNRIDFWRTNKEWGWCKVYKAGNGHWGLWAAGEDDANGDAECTAQCLEWSY